ncbi:hypothetical protein B5V02_01285 [Mesorhizobium kowhaii]|uniref:Uncharacterized protein n=1 Tax=Mesorhizobium kowhaii TaxID=1300272 RepID=A0A2W7CFA5_9HYPH|nr:hypothetical protein B5V02_01285 [Mesorhizobium kowhaii]
MAAEKRAIALAKRTITLAKWDVTMSEEMGQVVLRMFPTTGEPFPILLSPGQATRLGHDLQAPMFLPKITVQ